MPRESTSSHLLGTTELTVVMPIRQGFIEIRDTVSYATRLRLLLQILNRIRKQSLEAVGATEYVGPIERLRTIQFVRFCIFDNDTKLLLAVSFDRPWEPYIRAIHHDAGAILDAICCHCVGYTESHRSELGFAAFRDWVRKHQVDVDFFYAAEPSLTTDDLRYLKELEARQRKSGDACEFEHWVPEHSVSDPQMLAEQAIERTFLNTLTIPDESATTRGKELVEQGLRALSAMHALTKLYPDPRADDARFWQATAQSVLRDFHSTDWVCGPLRGKFQTELKWFEETLESRCEVTQPAAPDQLDNIQGNILTSYEGMTHGCLLFLQFTSAAEGRNFLGEIAGRITIESDGPRKRTLKKRKVPKVRKVPLAINLALTRHGLETLGLSPSQMRAFPKEFREGMEQRAGLLGDTRSNHPDHWTLPPWNWPDHPGEALGIRRVRLATIDAVVQLQAAIEKLGAKKYQFTDDNHEMNASHWLYEEVKRIAAMRGVTLLSVQTLRRKYKDKLASDRQRYVEEHFGYADGFSQPRVVRKPRDRKRDEISHGELLLGYRDDRGDRRSNVGAKDELATLLKDGSFLVMRKLQQHVGRFREFLDRESARQPISREHLQAKLVGRHTDGTPLVGNGGSLNDFDYADDPKGDACPLQAHIRRSNPRTVLKDLSPPPQTGRQEPEWAEIRRRVPRIMRRGFSYGPRLDPDRSDDGTDRGLVFMAYNASISEQFEVVQRWISGANSTGVFSAQDDPLLGIPPQLGQDRTIRFRHEGQVIRCRRDSESFVTLNWGMYLFAPSIAGLAALAGLDPAREPCDDGERIIAGLRQLEKLDPAAAAEKWTGVLEERSATAGGITAAVWAAIREKHDGTLRTPYGLLLASYDKVMESFRSTGEQSVREYWFRMRETIGEGFLGMDREPREIDGDNLPEVVRKRDRQYRKAVAAGAYEQSAGLVNPVIATTVSREKAYKLAYQKTEDVIAAIRNRSTSADKPALLELKDVGVDVMIELCREWFGVPRDRPPGRARPPRRMIENYLYTGRYIFASPRPSTFLKSAAAIKGRRNLIYVRCFVRAARSQKGRRRGTISRKLFKKISDDEQLAKTICGLCNGLVAPTLGSFLSVMHVLIATERLWRLQQRLALQQSSGEREYRDVESLLEPAVMMSMRGSPVPNMVYRTATAAIPTPKGDADPGAPVVLSIESATADSRIAGSKTDVLFGGDYNDSSSGAHACPGRDMGIGVIVGMLTAVLEAGELSPTFTPLTLWVNPGP
jgi:deferrochelatase/peroxidase EfeB